MKRLVSLVALAIVAFSTLLAQEPTREQMEAMIAQMPQLPNSDQVTIGKLDNGLTYYVRHNALPKGRAEFYLATNVGAIQEEYPSQDGLAHFLEHMCFNGTEHFPGKGILDYLRSIGCEFGRNINASTGFEETQYMLNNIPVERETVVDSCLMILADYSHYVLNQPVEIDAERGVIIEERRSRRDASWRTMEAALPYYFGEGTQPALHTLIGTQEHLETFVPESLTDFYQTWYHPANQAVVVVGDVDVERTVAKIAEIFGSIPAKENPKPKGIVAIEDHAIPRVGIITDPETTSPGVELIWHSPATPEAINATVYGQLNDIIKGVISMVMRERFWDITSKPDSPYLDGSFYISSLIYEDIDAVMGDVTLREDNILGGLKDFYTELVRLQRHGITDAEFGRVKADFLSQMETRANKAETRKNPEFVRPILSNFYDKEPILEPADEKELTEMLFSQLTVAAVNQVVAQIISPENFVMVYSGPQKEGIVTPTAEELLKVIADVNASDVAPLEGEDVPEAFLDPSKLKGSKVKKSGNTIYGAANWTLANGLNVVVYPTDLAKDQILFNYRKDGGLSLVSTDDIASFDDNIFRLFLNNSGVSSFSGTTLSKMLTGKNLSVTPYFRQLEHGVNGQSTVKDLETAFQLAYLFVTDPRFDPEEWQNGIDQFTAILPNLTSQPTYKIQARMYNTLFGGNARREFISLDKIQRANLQAVEKNWRKLMADAAGASLVIVGDVNPETLKPLVEKYFGSIAKGKKALTWVDPREDIVPGMIEDVFNVDMQTPKSTVLQVYTADIDFSYEKDAAMDAISYIMDMRYVNSLREEEGGTYGASANGNLDKRPKQRAMFEVYFDCKPAMCDKLRDIAIRQLAELATDGPTDEELSAAKLNLLKNIPENRQRNQWWLGNIDVYLRDGVDRDAAYEAGVNALSKESITSLLQDMLSQSNLIELVMKPAATAEAE